MFRTLLRLLPPESARGLAALALWLTAAATLQGAALGLVGVLIAALLDAHPAAPAWTAALAVVTVAFVLVQWRAQMIAFRSDTARALHLRLGAHLAQLPLGWFTPTRQAQLIDLATSGVPQSMSYPALLLRPAVTAVATPIAAAFTLAVLDWRFTIAVLLATVVAWYVSRVSDRLARSVDVRRHRVGAEATRRVLEYAAFQPVVRTDQREDADAFDRALLDVRAESLRSAGTVIPGLLAFSLTLNVLFAAVIALGVAFVLGATLTVPAFLGVLIVTARLSAIASAGAELAAGLRLQRGVLDKLAAVLDARPLPALESSGPRHDDDALVRAEHVSFGYDGTNVLNDVSFSLPRRGLTAVVGPSGAGKTTLARLLVRFWDPTSGEIRMNGRDIRSIPPETFAEHVATVFQDDYLLDTTLGENIRLGRPYASDDEVSDAVSAAGLGELVASLPDGLDSPVGPGGSRLSGGQRQRVCVARALLADAALTLMDEATSALDAENARLTREVGLTLAREKSVLVIAHNLDLAVQADQILVLDGGRLVDHGTFDELSGRNGPFQLLLSNDGNRCVDSRKAGGIGAPEQRSQ